MDSVRFGRALGMGARNAAKAVAVAAEAAAAPSPAPVVRPRAVAPRPSSTQVAASFRAVERVSESPASAASRTDAGSTSNPGRTSQNIVRGGRRFGEAVWGPFARLSGVLWLEITGSFFGLFALFAGQAVWTHRADLRIGAVNHDSRIHALVFLAMALVFGYFCISSFLRARRRERHR